MTGAAVRYAQIDRLGFRRALSRRLGGGRLDLGDVGWPSPARDLMRSQLERVRTLWIVLYWRQALPGNKAGAFSIQSAASLRRRYLVALQCAGWCDSHRTVAFVVYESRIDTRRIRGFRWNTRRGTT